jgi:spermidine synthase
VGGRFGARAAFVLIGFTAAVAQIVLLRELMAVFGGNEMSLGLMLASWLLWTAVGSAVWGRLAAHLGEPRHGVAALETLAALALPLTIYAVRLSKAALETVPGESLGPAAALPVSLAALSVFCLFSGALFTAAGRLRAHQTGAGAATATGAVYLLESLGAAAGGLLAGFVLVRFLGALQIACLLGLLNLLAALCFTLRRAAGRLAVALVLAGVFAVVWLPAGVPTLETASLNRLWPGYRLVAARNSAYGNLAVVEAEGSRSLYENGLLLFHAPDPEGAEEAVHYALLEHPAPRSLLLIGGGLNGSLGQALEHPSLERVDYVELDPAILDLARDYFPQTWAPIRDDARVHVHITDGRLFLRTTDLSFDVVIVNLPEPQTAQLNRYYTLEFFREAAAKTTPDGVLSFALPASETYISPDMAAFLQTIARTLGAAFAEVVAIPGDPIHFFAAKRAGVLTGDAGALLARLRERRLATAYVREYYLPFRMSTARMAALAARIEPPPGTRINRDFEPAAYYFDIALWSSRFSGGYARLLHGMASVSFRWLAACAALLAGALAVGALLRRGSRGREATAAASCAAAMGFTLIGLEVLLLLAFQAVYGSVYQQLALLIGAFMAGLALGSWLATRRAGESHARDLRALGGSQCLAALAPLAVCGLLALLPRLSYSGGQILLTGAALLCGAMGGWQFPVASRIFFSQAKPRGLGTLYALDLAGSCAGAVLFSAYLIPVFGFARTALLAAELNLGPAALVLLAGRRRVLTVPASETNSPRSA